MLGFGTNKSITLFESMGPWFFSYLLFTCLEPIVNIYIPVLMSTFILFEWHSVHWLSPCELQTDWINSLPCLIIHLRWNRIPLHNIHYQAEKWKGIFKNGISLRVSILQMVWSSQTTLLVWSSISNNILTRL